MPEDIEYRVALVRAMRKTGASFDVIADMLREGTRLAHERQRRQSFAKHTHEYRDAHCRQDVARGMRLQNAPYTQIGAALNISSTCAWNLVRRAEKRAAIPAWLSGLDIRTANVLLRAGFKSMEEIRNAITVGMAIERVKAPRMAMIKAWLQTTQ